MSGGHLASVWFWRLARVQAEVTASRGAQDQRSVLLTAASTRPTGWPVRAASWRPNSQQVADSCGSVARLGGLQACTSPRTSSSCGSGAGVGGSRVYLRTAG